MKCLVACVGIVAGFPFVNFSAESDLAPGRTSATNAIATPPQTSPGRVINSKEEMLRIISNGIGELESELKNTNLHPATRELLEKMLKRRQEHLAEVQTNVFVPVQIGGPSPQRVPSPRPSAPPPPLPYPPPNGGRIPQRSVRPPGDSSAIIRSAYAAQVEIMRTNPAAARINGFDPMGIAMQQSIANYEAEATNVDPALAKVFRQLAEDRKAQLADWTTNSQLWQNLRHARALKDPEKVETAKQELADYLARKMGKPSGMKLDDIMSEIRRSSSSTNQVTQRTEPQRE